MTEASTPTPAGRRDRRSDEEATVGTPERVSSILRAIADDDETTFGPKPPASELARKLPLAYQYLTKSRIENTRRKLAEPTRVKSGSSYAPWSREGFLSRLSTFSLKNWDVPYTDALKDMSCIEWAKRGWIALDVSATVSRNTLKCVHCTNMLTVTVGDNSDVWPALAVKYVDLIITKHREACPWRLRACNDQIYSLSQAVSVQKPLVLGRYRTLVPVLERLLSVEIKLPEALAGNPVTSLFGLSPVNPLLVGITLLGWKLLDTPGSASSSPILLSCDMCFRRIVLLPNSSVDLVAEHQPFCAYYQVDDSGTPQWTRLLQLVRSSTESPTQSRSVSPDTAEDDYVQGRKSAMSRLARLRAIYFSPKRT